MQIIHIRYSDGLRLLIEDSLSDIEMNINIQDGLDLLNISFTAHSMYDFMDSLNVYKQDWFFLLTIDKQNYIYDTLTRLRIEIDRQILSITNTDYELIETNNSNARICIW